MPKQERPVHRITRSDEKDFFEHKRFFQAVILGGGDLIRFDDDSLAMLYSNDSSKQSHSRSYRLFLYDLGKLARVMPVFWNAVGVPFDFEPEHYDLVCQATESVKYLSVRDSKSKSRLETAGVRQSIHVVPDSAFLISKQFSKHCLEKALKDLSEEYPFPIGKRILTLQISAAFEPLLPIVSGALDIIMSENPDLCVVLLPLGPCHGDTRVLGKLNNSLLHKAFLITPQTLEVAAAVIANSTYFAGSSFHGMITAAVYGTKFLSLSYGPQLLSKVHEYTSMLTLNSCLVDNVTALSDALRNMLNGSGTIDNTLVQEARASLNAHFDYLASQLFSA